MNKKSSELALVAVSLVCIMILAACNCSPTLRYITISPATSTIAVGTTQQYTATGYYSNGNVTQGFSVSWASSSTAVATIDPVSGIATAVGPGTTSITATALGITATSATLNVNQLLSIAVTPANPTIAIGATEQFTATGKFKNPDGTTSTSDVTAQVTWAAAPTTIATINTTTTPGLATGVATGGATITATLDGVSGSTGLTVGAPGPIALVISPVAPSIAVGNAIALTAQEKWSDGTTHPASGVTWVSDTPADANVVSISTNMGSAAGFAAGTANITATEGTLTGATSVTVVTGSTHYAYVSNINDGTVGVYTVNATTSPYLTADGTPVAIGANGVVQTVLNPNGQYMYVLDYLSNVYLYNITTGVPSNSGKPALVGGSGDSNYGIVDPYGRFLYVVDNGSTSPVEPTTIYGFTISPTDGSLTAIPGSPFTANLNSALYLVIDHSGQYLYATNNGSNTVSAYQISQTTGALTPLTTGATIATGSGPEFATLDPSGTHLYVANNGDGTVSGYSIGAGGVLTSLGTPTTVTGANSVLNVAVEPTGKYLYVLDAGNPAATPTPINGQLYGFTLTSGVPSTTPITGTPVATGLSPTGIAIDPTGKLIAVDNAGDGSTASTISLFTIGSGGALTSQTPVATGVLPIFVTFYNAP